MEEKGDEFYKEKKRAHSFAFKSFYLIKAVKLIQHQVQIQNQ